MKNYTKILALALFLAPPANGMMGEDEGIGKGGRPKKNPTLGNKVAIHNTNERVKFDDEGKPYIGASTQELYDLGAYKEEVKPVQSGPIRVMYTFVENM